MTDGLKAVIQLLEDDPELRETVSAAKTQGEVLRLLTNAGLHVDLNDIWPRNPDAELSDSELAAVAGGMTYPSFACPPPQTMVWPLGPC